MKKIRILGIAGSPRHANTEIGVQEALAGAAELPNVETEFYTMADKKINPCSCTPKEQCWTEGTLDNLCPRWGQDAIALLHKKMLTFDGFIIGSPSYMGGVTSQIKMLWDRIAPPSYAITHIGLRNKVVGAIAVGGYRSGGQEETILEIWKFAISMDMIPVGLGPELQGRVCMWGGSLTHSWSSETDLRAAQIPGSPEERSLVKGDILGMLSCRNTGRRVAEMAKVIQAGFTALPREETYWPFGPAGGVAATDWRRE